MTDTRITDMVFGFDSEHPIGVVCGPGCEFCHPPEDHPALSMYTIGPTGGPEENVPLKILAPATVADWRRVSGSRGNPPVPFFYFVATD